MKNNKLENFHLLKFRETYTIVLRLSIKNGIKTNSQSLIRMTDSLGHKTKLFEKKHYSSIALKLFISEVEAEPNPLRRSLKLFPLF